MPETVCEHGVKLLLKGRLTCELSDKTDANAEIACLLSETA